MWNRTLATVLCTFCRPHLPKVLRHHQFFKKTILKCKSSSCHGPVHVFDDGWLTWWYGCHDETWTWWQDCPWTFVRNSEVYNYSLSSTTLCWLAELRSFSFLKFKTYQVDEGWGQQIEVIDYSCKLVHGEQRTPPGIVTDGLYPMWMESTQFNRLVEDVSDRAWVWTAIAAKSYFALIKYTSCRFWYCIYCEYLWITLRLWSTIRVLQREWKSKHPINEGTSEALRHNPLAPPRATIYCRAIWNLRKSLESFCRFDCHVFPTALQLSGFTSRAGPRQWCWLVAMSRLRWESQDTDGQHVCTLRP